MAFAIIDGMTIKIDNAGRIVLPKPVRDRLGLKPGAAVEMTEGPEGVTLAPATQKPSMIRIRGFWVHQGSAPKGFDWDRHLEEERNRRHRELLGR